MVSSNGGEREVEASLSERRKAAVAAGLEQYNHVSEERDRFEAETRELRTQIAGYKVALEANAARINDLESRVKSMQFERDQAVLDRGKWEGLFVTVLSTLRAFGVKNQPMIKDHSEEADRALDHLRQSAQQQAAMPPYRPDPNDFRNTRPERPSVPVDERSS